IIDLTSEDRDEYYNGFANRVLWPVLNYRIDLAEYSRRDLTGYLRVNDHFALELHKLIQPNDIIWVHDYHLLPLARMLRERGHHNRIGFFLHAPFPPPEILTALPNHERLVPSMAYYDVIGFQTENDTDNFARYLMPGTTAGRINATYGEASWTPIRYVNRTYNRTDLAGLYRAARVALVTPLRDGMNLAA